MALTIYDLQQVCEKLESASPKWFDLGLALGLSHPDLTNIKEHNGDNQKCLREMLAKLLGTQRVTWSLLSDGLKTKTVGLCNLADTIAAGLDCVEEEAVTSLAVCEGTQATTSLRESDGSALPSVDEVTDSGVIGDSQESSSKRERDENQLCIDDLQDVFSLLINAEKSWFYLGLALHIKPGTLEGIKSKESCNTDRLCEMLTHWLRSSPSRTWSEICKGLRSDTVKQDVLADTIEEKYKQHQLTYTKSVLRNAQMQSHADESEITSYRDKCDDLKQQLCDTTEEKNMISVKLKNKDEELRTLRYQKRMTESELKSQVRDSQLKLEDMKTKTEQLEEQDRELQEKIAKCEQENNRLTAKLQTYENIENSLLQQIEELKEENRVLTIKNKGRLAYAQLLNDKMDKNYYNYAAACTIVCLGVFCVLLGIFVSMYAHLHPSPDCPQEK